VCGTEGTAVVENWDGAGKIVRLTGEAMMKWEDEIFYTSAGPTRTMAPRPKHTVTELPLPEVTADWVAYYENIAAVLKGEAELIVRPEQALRVMKVIDAAFASSVSGQSVALRV
jgi:predicted dehydrogenase